MYLFDGRGGWNIIIYDVNSVLGLVTLIIYDVNSVLGLVTL
jgi:hypothetical protein